MQDKIYNIINETLKSFNLENINFTVEKPKDLTWGDYASNVALTLSAKLKKNPLEIGESIIKNLDTSYFDSVELVKPGFINFKLSLKFLQDNLKIIMEQKEKYGYIDLGKGKKVNIEFVSANPTGPLHIGHGRWAVIGDTLARVLKISGYEVYKEFYINNVGTQIYNLGRSLLVRYLQILEKNNISIPDKYQELLNEFRNDTQNNNTNFYHGNYLIDIANKLYIEYGKNFLDKDINEFSNYAMDIILNEQRELLSQIRVNFDIWFKESDLHNTVKNDKSFVEETIELLKNKGKVILKDKAWWLVGDDKDNVLIKSDGNKTYFAADIAYHRNKYDRGFDKLIVIWGADHHGHVKRMKNAVEYLGKDPNTLDIIIGQLVTLYKNGEVVRMSKRTGEMITLKEVVQEVGVDALRYLLAMKHANNTIDFDLDLAIKESKDNPVFYVQYAHARICSILRMAQENLSITLDNLEPKYLELLTCSEERQLMLRLVEYIDVINLASKELSAHYLTIYAQNLATDFHYFYTNCRVLNSEDIALTKARIYLCVCTKIVLRNLLEDLLGVTAPTAM